MRTQREILMEDPEYRRLYAIEGLVTDAADLVARLMEQQGIKEALTADSHFRQAGSKALLLEA